METGTALDFRAFAFIITLAAVVNGLGIVRWLSALSEYMARRDSLNIRHYWVYNLLAAYQFLLHVLLWWTLWSVRDAANINFLTYLYLLTGPVFLFLGTSLLVPSIETDGVDIRTHFSKVRPMYASVLALLWVWAILAGPILRGALQPTVPLLATFFALALALRLSRNATVHAVVAVAVWLPMIVFITLYSMQLG